MSCCRLPAQPLGRLSARTTLTAPRIRAFSSAVAFPEGEASNKWTENRSDNRPDNRRRDRDGRDGRDGFNGARRNRDGFAPRQYQGQQRRGGPAVPVNHLAQLLSTFATLKEEGRKPTAAAYITLIKAAAAYGARRGSTAPPGQFSLGFEIALGALRDAEAGGIELGIEALDQLLRFSIVHPEILPSLLLEFAKRQVSSPATYNTLAGQALLPGRVEELIMILHEMFEQNMVPSQAVVRQTIRLTCEWGLSRLALDLVKRIQDMPGASPVASESWVQILMTAADQQDLATVEEAWDHVTKVQAYTPDEGLLLSVLAVAARWGKPALATRALAALTDIGVTKKEHHLAPLIEAFCRDGRVPDAIEAVGLIREAGITPTLQTVRPIADVLRSAEVVDQAFYCLEDRVKDGKEVDVSVFNALIYASAKAGDLQRARATQLAAPDLGVTPNLDTFNCVLKACAESRHKDLSQTVLEEMSAAGFAPDAKTYESMIRLALSQPEYEDAFYYLEKMKADGIKPSRDLYKALGMKCVASDDKRYSLVEDEMFSIGYGRPNFVMDYEKKLERQQRGRDRDSRRGGREDGEGRPRERRERREPREQREPRQQRDGEVAAEATPAS